MVQPTLRWNRWNTDWLKNCQIREHFQESLCKIFNKIKMKVNREKNAKENKKGRNMKVLKTSFGCFFNDNAVIKHFEDVIGKETKPKNIYLWIYKWNTIQKSFQNLQKVFNNTANKKETENWTVIYEKIQ